MNTLFSQPIYQSPSWLLQLKTVELNSARLFSSSVALPGSHTQRTCSLHKKVRKMRTRKQSQLPQQSNGEEERTKRPRNAEKCDDSETLANISKDAVGRLLKRVKSHGSRGLNKVDDSYLRNDISSGSSSMLDGALGKRVKNDDKDSSREATGVIPLDSGTVGEIDESEWEDGSLPALNTLNNSQELKVKGVTVELDVSLDAAKQKRIHRATAEEKELAELVHKVNLLCLLGRGRLFDVACDDPLIQASLLSLLPIHLLKIDEVPKLTTKALAPLVGWFHRNFRVRSPDGAKKLPSFALASALEAHEGTAEEVAALSVALFRALNLTARFVAVLDVVSLKPDADKPESSSQGTGKAGSGIFNSGIFNSSTLMVPESGHAPISLSKDLVFDEKDGDHRASISRGSKIKARKSPEDNSSCQDLLVVHESNSRIEDQSTSEHQDSVTVGGVAEKSGGPKRKGDLEFEMQLEMALSSTAIANSKRDINSNVVNADNNTRLSSFKKLKAVGIEESSVSSSGMSTAVGSGKVGAPLYWAEVYCTGENLTEKWVHIDAVNAIIDGELKVEAALAACKKSLRYVVAFAGLGAKDVTRRYCSKWYKIASERVNSIWWQTVLAPLKKLEAQATGGIVHLEQGASSRVNKVEAMPIADKKIQVSGPEDTSEAREDCTEEKKQRSLSNSFATTRSSLEDMELDTKALTEPLPSNQQAYKNHPLYAIERWLKQYQIMYPKGPIVGFCSGHPVYPRTCVQSLHTKERWLREGLQVKADELPVKILKRSLKQSKVQTDEDDEHEYAGGDQVALYGKWQTETLSLPCAVDGIVPKNERGQVDVWSEKCLPPGTVHLRLPRVALVAKRLEIDFAPAMVGFEFRNRRPYPVFEGIVVCAEFEDAVLEAYEEEEHRREAVERKRDEAQALSRWYQLLSSIVTRQRLKNCYGDGTHSRDSAGTSNLNDTRSQPAHCSLDRKKSPGSQKENLHEKKPNTAEFLPTEDHEHVFLLEDETSDGMRTKRCQCGFSIQFEEL